MTSQRPDVSGISGDGVAQISIDSQIHLFDIWNRALSH